MQSFFHCDYCLGPSVSNGRIQVPGSTAAGGILTRSKHAQETTKEEACPSPIRDEPRNGERSIQDERNMPDIQQERVPPQVVNKRLTVVCNEPGIVHSN